MGEMQDLFDSIDIMLDNMSEMRKERTILCQKNQFYNNDDYALIKKIIIK